MTEEEKRERYERQQTQRMWSDLTYILPLVGFVVMAVVFLSLLFYFAPPTKDFVAACGVACGERGVERIETRSCTCRSENP